MSVKAAFFALIPADWGRRSAQRIASTIQTIPKPLVGGCPSAKPILAGKAFVFLFAKRQRIVGFFLGCRIAILKGIAGEALSKNSKPAHTPQNASTVLALQCPVSTMQPSAPNVAKRILIAPCVRRVSMPHPNKTVIAFLPAKRIAIVRPPRSTSATKAAFAASPNRLCCSVRKNLTPTSP